MIERMAFARVMGGFADRIGRALAPETAEMYYDVLASELTTDQFMAGARIVFRSHTYNTWPSPQQFIDAIKPKASASLDAADVFETVLEIVNRTSLDWSERQRQIMALGPIVERAYRAAGGRREMECVPVESVPFTRRRFVEAFEHATENEARQSDAAGALEAVSAPRLTEMEDGAAMVVQGLARMKSLPSKRPDVLPLSGRDRAAGERP